MWSAKDLEPRNHSRAEQLSLFPLTLDELVAETSVSINEMGCWRSKQWLSFDAAHSSRYERAQYFEVVFIKALAHSGLDEAMINRALCSLSKPYSYDPADTFFSFAESRWIGLPTPSEPDPATVTAEYIEELANSEDWEKLRTLHQRIASALEEAQDSDD